MKFYRRKIKSLFFIVIITGLIGISQTTLTINNTSIEENSNDFAPKAS